MKEACSMCPIKNSCTTLEARSIRNKMPRLPTECMKYTCSTGVFEAEKALNGGGSINFDGVLLFRFGSEDKPTNTDRCSHRRYVDTYGNIYYAFKEENPYKTGQNIFDAQSR